VNKLFIVCVCMFSLGYCEENREADQVISHIQELKGTITSPKQAKEFIESYIQTIEKEYGVQIDRKEVIRLTIREIDKQEFDQETKEKLKNFFFKLYDQKYYASLSIGALTPKLFTSKDLPADVVIGGIEIFAGVLLYLLPGCKVIGGTVIADGATRVLNGIKEAEEENKKKEKQNFITSKPMNTFSPLPPIFEIFSRKKQSSLKKNKE